MGHVEGIYFDGLLLSFLQDAKPSPFLKFQRSLSNRTVLHLNRDGAFGFEGNTSFQLTLRRPE